MSSSMWQRADWRHRSFVVAPGSEVLARCAATGSGCWRPRSRRGGLADGSCCWRASSAICLSSGVGGGHRRAVFGVRASVLGRLAVGPRACRSGRWRRDGRGAARGRGGVGERGAELRVGAAVRFCGSVSWRGWSERDLSQAALVVRGRRARRCRGGSAGRMLARCWVPVIGACALGRRDYAMIILLLRLGLRRGEVAGLRLMTSTGGRVSW